MSSSMVAETSSRKLAIRIVAWSLTILLSWFPDILSYELTENVPVWLGWLKVGLVLTFVAVSFLWKEIRVLRNCALVYGVLWLSFKVQSWVGRTSWFQSLSDDMGTISSSHQQLLGQFLGLIPVVVMILTLLLLLRQWSRFFFAKGGFKCSCSAKRCTSWNVC